LVVIESKTPSNLSSNSPTDSPVEIIANYSADSKSSSVTKSCLNSIAYSQTDFSADSFTKRKPGAYA
jgi:hypothetical protein